MTFLTGGGARGDVQSLIVLRPAGALFLGLGLWGLTGQHVAAFRFLFALAGLCLLLVLAHVVPLPPEWWSALPGRALMVEVEKAAEVETSWRPLSMVPFRTWSGLFALLVPMAALILTVRCTREQRFGLLPFLIGFGLLSGSLGLLQAIGPTHGPLYFYRITNPDSAVGLFSNRNHQAALLACMFPMLAAYASTGARSVEQARFRKLVALGMAVVLIPLLLVTGSRAGVALGIIGLASVPLVYRRPQLAVRAKRRVQVYGARYFFIGAGAFFLIVLTLLFSRARALERFVAPDRADDLRFSIWGPILDLAWKYFPLGSGLGSFVEVYKLDEPLKLLAPTYVNHAHNDWLEIMMTGGLPALILLGVAVAAWVIASWQVFVVRGERHSDAIFGRLGAVVVLILGLASMVDYPLRVPSLACLFVVAAVWLAGHRGLVAAGDDRAVESSGVR